MPAPKRASNIPKNAEWDPDERTWAVVATDANGAREGAVRWWSKDGQIACEATHHAGRLEGPARRVP